MALNIRNPEADALARQLAAIEGSAITEAVILALKEALSRRAAAESPQETARRLLERHGITPSPASREPVSPDVWRELDGDLHVR